MASTPAAPRVAPPFIDPPGYARHWPEETLLYQLIEQHYPAFLAAREAAGRPTSPAELTARSANVGGAMIFTPWRFEFLQRQARKKLTPSMSPRCSVVWSSAAMRACVGPQYRRRVVPPLTQVQHGQREGIEEGRGVPGGSLQREVRDCAPSMAAAVCRMRSFPALQGSRERARGSG